MGDITANISQYELDCTCGECNVTIDSREPVIQLVQDCGDRLRALHKATNLTIKITSAARCYSYNRLQPTDDHPEYPGSNDNSQHPRSRAIDFKIILDGIQVPPREVYEDLVQSLPTKCGIGLYRTFTHLDSRPWCARWSMV